MKSLYIGGINNCIGELCAEFTRTQAIAQGEEITAQKPATEPQELPRFLYFVFL